MLSEIPVQSTIAPAVKKCFYEITPDEEEAGHTYLVIGKVLGGWQDREKITAAAVLSEALTGSNDAPLKRALLDTGLCLDVSLDVSDGILQPFGCLCINNTDEENCGKLKETVRSAVSGLCSKGIDRQLLTAALNRMEFRFRAGGEPRGLTRNISALSAWLYGGDPLYYLELGEVYDSLRSKVNSGYFEELLREWLLDENGRAELYLLPSRTYGEEQKAAEKKRLSAIVDGLSCEERSVIVEQNRQLDEWQQSVDTPEQLATMPHLALSEVSPEPLRFDTEETSVNGVAVLKHTAQDNGIAALNLYFSLADCGEEQLSAASAASELFGELPTSKTSAADLQRRITGLLGSINFGVDVFSKTGVSDKCTPYLSVKARFLDKNGEEALGLIAEILTETDFSDISAVTELLKQTDENYKQSIIANGHSYSMMRVRAALSAESAVSELVSGYEGYKRLHEAIKSPEKLVNEMKALSGRMICTARLTASVTGNIDIQPLLEALPEGVGAEHDSMGFKLDIPEKQGIIIPSGVSYSAMAFPDASADGAVRKVLYRALSLEYLWNEVRVKGGAYGTGAVIAPSGEQTFFSYRDPSPSASIEIYRKAADFIADYCEGAPDITQYIISTIAKEEPLMSDGNRSAKADGLWFRGISDEERADEKKRMLGVTAAQLREAAETLRSFGNVCVMGTEAAMEGLDLKKDSLA